MLSLLHLLLFLGYMVLKVVVESMKQMCNLQGEDSAVCLNNPSVLLPPLLLPFLLLLLSLMQVFFLDLYAYLKILKKSAVK